MQSLVIDGFATKRVALARALASRYLLGTLATLARSPRSLSSYALGPRLEFDVDLLLISVAEDQQGHRLPRTLP